MSDTDLQLLERYSRLNAEDAFAEIVRRHISLVFSAALRQVRSPQLAEEVAQSAFTDLARQAGRLAPDTILQAWLYKVACRTAIDVVRREGRRQLREQVAYETSAMNATAEDWSHIEPLLDEAMQALDDTDRAAVLLRYFEKKSLREVGESIGTNEDAARKRVSRAVERLREYFAKRGVATGASALASVISANAIQVAPAGLAATISTAALAGTTISALTATNVLAKTIAMTTLQKTFIVAVLVAASFATPLVLQHQTHVKLREENESLRQEIGRLAQVQAENARLSNMVARADYQRSLGQQQMSELMKLRSQAGQAQSVSRDLAKLKATVAAQDGKMPDFLTNAMAEGLSTAEKWKKKDALARLARMKTSLNLTDDQEQAIRDIMMQHVENGSRRALSAITGKLTPDQSQAMAGDRANQEAEIKAIFSPQQLAAYPDYKQAEIVSDAQNSARNDAKQMSDDLHLSQDQQDRVYAALTTVNLNQQTKLPNQEATAQAHASGNYADIVNMQIETQKQTLDEQMKALDGILGPDQIKTYQQAKLDQIETQARAMRMFLPRATGSVAP